MVGAATGDGLGDVCDSDGDDGFMDAAEGTIGTVVRDNCAGSPGPGGDAWPADFDANKVVNITDVGDVLPPTFGSTCT